MKNMCLLCRIKNTLINVPSVYLSLFQLMIKRVGGVSNGKTGITQNAQGCHGGTRHIFSENLTYYQYQTRKKLKTQKLG